MYIVHISCAMKTIVACVVSFMEFGKWMPYLVHITVHDFQFMVYPVVKFQSLPVKWITKARCCLQQSWCSCWQWDWTLSPSRCGCKSWSASENLWWSKKLTFYIIRAQPNFIWKKHIKCKEFRVNSQRYWGPAFQWWEGTVLAAATLGTLSTM